VVEEAEVHIILHHLLHFFQVNLEQILNLLFLANHLEKQQQQVVVEETHTMIMLPVPLLVLVDLVVEVVDLTVLVLQVNILQNLIHPHPLETQLQ
tara:strand:- start:613 stop:897 length:285 start_codon:yes stop_codon:yes gene_type:complete